MLSNEEKREMLEDAKNKARQKHFRFAKKYSEKPQSLDEYINFLNSVQIIFNPFITSQRPTVTKLNKL